MHAMRLTPVHFEAVRALLERRPEVNLFTLSVLWRQGLPTDQGAVWLGAFDEDGVLVSVVFAPAGSGGPLGTAVPEGRADGVRLLGRHLHELGGTHCVVGPREASDALWAGLGDPPRRISYDQRLYVLREVSEGPTLPVELATLDDLACVAEHAGAMLGEDLGLDPRAADPAGHVHRVRQRIRRGSTLVVREGSDIVFQIDVGTDGSLGAQVGGTYVPPAWRGRGIATRAMRGVGRRLLRRRPMVTLHVNEANLPAVRTYERAGFDRSAPFRLVSI